MLDRMTDTIDFHGKALQLRAQRQEVLSSNIANADTPGFKARDFDFSSALRTATSQSSLPPAGSPAPAALPLRAESAGPAAGGTPPAGLRMSQSQAGHLQGAGGGLAGAGVEHSTRLQYTAPEQASLDGNSVDLNRERAAFADNSLRYEATLRFINGRVRTMMTAIRGE